MKSRKYLGILLQSSLILSLMVACDDEPDTMFTETSTQEVTSHDNSEEMADSLGELSVGGTETMNSTSKIVTTGQKDTFDDDGAVLISIEGQDYYGQDGHYSDLDFSFTKHDDGTTSDHNTGLMWQTIPMGGKMNWDKAIDYCNSLELGGYSDWRIPTVEELFSISDFSVGWPYLDSEFFSFDQSNSRETSSSVSKGDGQFWTASHNLVEGDARLGDIAFGVNHSTGHIKAYPASTSSSMGKYVRAVRGDIYGAEEFVDNGDGTISDLTSGLMWSADDLGVGVDWGDALELAENSEFAGYSDWRLPNVKELQSIVDYGGAYPAINQDYFSCTTLAVNENYYYWTSTSAYFSTKSPDYDSAWYVAFGYTSHGAGAVRFSPKYEGSKALAEGGDNILNSVRLVRSI